MTNENRLETVAKADEVAGLMNEMGWDEIVKPALLKERNTLSTLLVAAVLGKEAPGQLTREQIAGMIYGIDRLTSVFEAIIKKGNTALSQLESQGFHLTSTNL